MAQASPFEERIRQAISEIANDPERACEPLAGLASADPAAFRAVALAELRVLPDGPGRKCLLEVTLNQELLPACDPAVLPLEEEIALTRELIGIDPALDMRLAKRLSASPERLPDKVAHRLLDLLGEVSDSSRVLPLLVKLIHDPNPRIRSKAALVVGRKSRTAQTAEQLLREPDARVRANAIQGLWGMDTQKARHVLRAAADDPNNRVVGNALLGLFRLGETVAVPRLLAMAAHPNAAFRATAAWAMKQTDAPQFLHVLSQMVRETNPTARRCVFQAIAGLKQAKSKADEAAPLGVHILAIAARSDGTRVLRTAITSPSGKAAGLEPTGVALWENSRLVADYSVRKLPVADCLTVGLVLPAGEAYDGVLERAAALKRERDRVSTLRYTAAAGEALTPSVLKLLDSMRHLVIAAVPEPPHVDWDAVLAQARLRRAAVHAIAGGGPASRELRSLADQTGGISVTAEDAGDLPRAYAESYLGMLHIYEITCSTGEAEALPGPFRLEVYAESGYGSDSTAPGIRVQAVS